MYLYLTEGMRGCQGLKAEPLHTQVGFGPGAGAS